MHRVLNDWMEEIPEESIARQARAYAGAGESEVCAWLTAMTDVVSRYNNSQQYIYINIKTHAFTDSYIRAIYTDIYKQMTLDNSKSEREKMC